MDFSRRTIPAGRKKTLSCWLVRSPLAAWLSPKRLRRWLSSCVLMQVRSLPERIIRWMEAFSICAVEMARLRRRSAEDNQNQRGGGFLAPQSEARHADIQGYVRCHTWRFSFFQRG